MQYGQARVGQKVRDESGITKLMGEVVEIIQDNYIDQADPPYNYSTHEVKHNLLAVKTSDGKISQISEGNVVEYH